MSSEPTPAAAPPAGNAKAAKKAAKKKRPPMIELHSVAGTRDFPPTELATRTWLFNKWREVARRFAFEEYDAPLLEPQELYKRKAGEDITQEMYAFEDHSGAQVALRPEMTPSLARIIMGMGTSVIMPIRWFSIPQCWRYETLARGRRREHFQWNMDIFGVSQVTAEAELLAAICTFFGEVGLTCGNVQIRVSSRKLVQCVLEHYGVAEDQFAPTCVIVDKLDKLTKEQVLQQLEALGISAAVGEQIIAALGVKGDMALLEEMVGADVVAPALADLRQLMDLMGMYGFREFIQFDASVVRGLAYYTGVVFEAFWADGALQRAICGGGRYDKLLSMYGGRDVPAVGFGFGDCVILEILQEKGLLDVPTPRVDDVVLAWSEAERGPATEIAMRLRDRGSAVDIIMNKKKVKWAFSYADRVGAERVIMVGPDELAKGVVRVKYLRKVEGDDSKEVDVPLGDL